MRPEKLFAICAFTKLGEHRLNNFVSKQNHLFYVQVSIDHLTIASKEYYHIYFPIAHFFIQFSSFLVYCYYDEFH